jgi:small subunit ribosomal protein S15
VPLQKEKKEEIISHFKLHETDTGSPEVQVSLLTQRINEMTLHMQQNPKDLHSRHGLLKMVGRRRRLLDYLKRKDIESYRNLISQLELRR